MIGGIELGGTKCVVALAESPDKIISKEQIATKDPESTFVEIISFFDGHNVENLGIGSFGPLVLDFKSKDYGLLVTESKKGWGGINIVERLSKICSNIFIDTDVNAAALGEYNYGAGKLCDNLVYVTIGTGIGVGILLKGMPHLGNFHVEAGHMRIPNVDAIPGVCKIHGDCWEGLASGPAIQMRCTSNLEEMSETHEIWDEEAKLLAFGLINIISTYSPDRIILGGGVMKQKILLPQIITYVKEIWNNYTPLIDLNDLIVEPGLDQNSGIIGSLALTL